MEVVYKKRAGAPQHSSSEGGSADVVDVLPPPLQDEIASGDIPPGLIEELGKHSDALTWLDTQGFSWDQAFLAGARAAQSDNRLGEFVGDHVGTWFDRLFQEFHQGHKIDDAGLRRFVTRMLVGKNGQLDLTCAKPLSTILVWCEDTLGSLLNVVRLRLAQFARDPELVKLFDSIARRVDGPLTIHPHAHVLMEADRHQPGGPTLSPQEVGQILLGACIWPERQGEAGVCAMVAPQLTVYCSDLHLLLTELKSFVEDGVVCMVRDREQLALEVPSACQLSNAELQRFPIEAGAALKGMPSLCRALDFLYGKPLDPATHDTIVRDALLTLSKDKTYLPASGTSLNASLWDICLAAVANQHRVTMAELVDIMNRPLSSKNPVAAQLRNDVERARLALISSSHSILSKAWFEVFAAATNLRTRQTLCDEIVAELFPSRIAEGWPGATKAKEDLRGLLMQKCQLLPHEEVNGFRLFVRTAAMGERGLRVTSVDMFADCMASVIDEWAAQVLRAEDGSTPQKRAQAVADVLELCRHPEFASRVHGRLPRNRFKGPWLTTAGTVSTRHTVVDGVRHLSSTPRREASIRYSCDLIDEVLKDTASDLDRLAHLSEVEKCSTRLNISARNHHFAVLYGQPCWGSVRASGMSSDEWLKKHLSEPGRAWSRQPWIQEELEFAWKQLDKVIPNYNPAVDGQYIDASGGRSSPEKFIALVKSLIHKKGGKDEATNLERLSLVIGCTRGAPLFVVADLNYDGANSLLCFYHDPCRDAYLYVRSSDRVDAPFPGDAAAMPRARVLGVDDLKFYAEEGGAITMHFW